MHTAILSCCSQVPSLQRFHSIWFCSITLLSFIALFWHVQYPLYYHYCLVPNRVRHPLLHLCRRLWHHAHRHLSILDTSWRLQFKHRHRGPVHWRSVRLFDTTWCIASVAHHLVQHHCAHGLYMCDLLFINTDTGTLCSLDYSVFTF